MAASEADEVASLDRLLTRLALTEDSKLEKVLRKLIPLSVSRLQSPSNEVRKKVFEMLVHINQRVRDHPHIQLPVFSMLELYRSQTSEDFPLVFNMSLQYLEMGFERSPPEVMLELFPDLIESVSTRPKLHQDRLLRCSALAIGTNYSIHGEKLDQLKTKCRFLNKADDVSVFLEFLLHSLLFNPLSLPSSTTPTASSLPHNEAISVHPCLSSVQIGRICGNAKNSVLLQKEKLIVYKLGILNLLSSMNFNSQDIYLHFLVSSIDSDEKVSKRGEELLKKCSAVVNLEEASLIKTLYSLYLGNSFSRENISNSLKIPPANVSLKFKILSQTFLHSITSANFFPSTLDVIIDSIYVNQSNFRLKQIGMEFSVWVFKHAKEEELRPISNLILENLLKLLDQLHDPESKESPNLKSFTYQAIGQLFQRVPNVVKNSPSIALKFFDYLENEDAMNVSSLQECLTFLSNGYQDCDENVRKEIESLLAKSIESKQSATRFCALQWCIRIFPFQNSFARYICILGLGDSKLENRELAERGLQFTSKKENSSHLKRKKEDDGKEEKIPPAFSDMVDFVIQQKSTLLTPSPMEERDSIFPSAAYLGLLRFLDVCRHKELKNQGEKIQMFNRRFLRIIEHSFSKESNYDLHSFASKLFLEYTCNHPEEMSSEFCPRFSWLKQFLSHSDLSVRENFSRTIGIIASNPNSSQLDMNREVQEWLSTAKNVDKTRAEVVHGSICTLGYSVAQLRESSNISDSLLEEATAVLFSLLSYKSDLVTSGVVEALGLISLTKPLPLPLGDTSLLTSLPSSPPPGPITQVSVLLQIISLLKSNDIRTVKKSLICLSHISMGEPSFSVPIVSVVFSLSRSKVEDVLFAAGDAIAILWGEVYNFTPHTILSTPFQSLSSSSNLLTVDIDNIFSMKEDIDYGLNSDVKMKNAADVESSQQLNEVREMIWKNLNQELLISPRKEERCAGVIWLLSLVSYCGRSKKILSLLFEIQEAFSNLLGDSNDLTQEMASRGMSMVYNLGDENTKKQLVDALVNNLTGNTKKKRVIKLTNESEVLNEEDIKSKGKNFNNTYKELCDMATDLGHPELIYKFMDVANYQNALNSGRGAAFGFAQIANEAREMLKPHIANLIPKLYRAQYDPSKSIQDAMTHIWYSLIDDPEKSISQYLNVIFEDLISNMGSRYWRNRESASLALSDLLLSKKYEQVFSYLERFWTMCFRVCDDIKESVRNAGEKLCRTLTSLSIRLCDSSLTKSKDAEQACEVILPLLLSKGILSSMDGIRKSSLLTISKIIKVAGPSIRSNIIDVISSLLESLSSLEDQSLNYVELHAERAGIDSEKLENLRTSMSRDSLMWQSLQTCVSQVDSSVLPNLIPRVVQIVRSGVGLNTKVGASRFLSLLIQHLPPSAMSPYTSSLLHAFYLSFLHERSATVKRTNARTFCETCKIATSSLVSKYIGQLRDLYFNASDRDARWTAAIVFNEFSNNASDCIRSEFTQVYPLVFFSRFDEDESISQSFNHVFDEISGAQTAMAKLHIEEIVAIIKSSFSSSSWAFKIQSAKASMDLSQVLKEDMDANQLQSLVSLFSEELPGRLWEGKEIILDALAVFCECCSKKFVDLHKTSTQDIFGPGEIISVLLLASQRKKQKFKNSALEALNKVVRAFPKFDSFSRISPPLLHGLQAPTEDDSCISPLLGMKLLSSSLESATFESEYFKNAYSPIKKIAIHFLQNSQPWNVRVEALIVIKTLVSKFKKSPPSVDVISIEDDSFLEEELVALIVNGYQDMAKVRKATVECIFSILHSPCKEKFISSNSSALIHECLANALQNEKDSEVKSIIKKCVEN